MADSSHLDTKTSHGKLPFWETIGKAYSAFFKNFATLLWISWPWLILVCGLIWYVPFPPRTWQNHVAGLALALVTLISAAAIAVAWHRKLLLGEQPDIGGKLLGSTIWRYIGAGIAMILAVAIPLWILVLPVALVWMPGFLDPATAQLTRPLALSPILFALMFAAYLVAFYFMFRLMLVLPARAIGNNDLNFRSILKHTKGNTWRLIGGLALCTIPPALPVQIITFSSMSGLHTPGQPFDPAKFMESTAIASGGMTAYGMLVSMIWLGFLSYAYRHFFEKP